MLKLTVIIPTYKRNKLVEDCLSSAVSMFGDNACYIVGNSYSDDVNNIIYSKFGNHNIVYLDLHEHECDMYQIYKNLLAEVATEYVIVLEDDDKLINQQLHLHILDVLHNYDLVTFASTDGKNMYMDKFSYDSDWQEIPIRWGGEYQFGMTYFKTRLLREAFDMWFKDIANRFVYSSDEALALIVASKSRKLAHFNEIGLKIGVQDDNLSWNNLPFSLYSSCSYIDSIQKMLGIRRDNIQKYKHIQLAELQTMSNKKLSDSVCSSKYVKYIQENVKQKIASHISAKDIKAYIYAMMQMYLTKVI